jgi:glutamine synthetase
VRDARAQLERAGVKYVLSCWVDLLGVPKTKPVPLERWEELCAGRGPQFAVHSISMAPELGPADPDQVPVPDLDSLVVCPWNTEYAWVFADLHFNGAPYAVCPRGALKRQIDLARQGGYEFYAGIEPEFIVMRYDEQGRPIKAFDEEPTTTAPADRLRRQAFGYDAEFSLHSMPFLGEVTDMLNGLDWGVSNVVAEGAYSQFELDFGYTTLLGAADRLTFLRILLKEVARRHGYFVTYMAKPTQGDWRSGAHINHSIRACADPTANLFGGEHGEWGTAAYQAVAGLMRHARALTAITCSTVNSYKGLIARARGFEGGTVTWAPTHISYGANNRSTTFRLPQARFAIENRAADMCMNPYLALAVTAAASLEGINEQLDPGPPVNTDLYALSPAQLEEAGIEPLPANLLEAVHAYEEDDLVRSVLGDAMHEAYGRYKRDEWARFHEHITEWETREYLRFF